MNTLSKNRKNGEEETNRPIDSKQVLSNGGKLKELVDSYVRDQIFEQKKLSPGDQINEREISRVLGLSRAPIREALKELEEQGLIVSEKYRGWFVADFREDEFLEINKLRSLLEYSLLESVLSQGGPSEDEIEGLFSISEEMREVAQGADPDELKIAKFAEKEMFFHSSLHELGKEGCFWTKKMLRNLSYQLRSALLRWIFEKHQMEMSISAHDMLLDCLKRKDRTALREILFKRLENGPWAGYLH